MTTDTGDLPPALRPKTPVYLGLSESDGYEHAYVHGSNNRLRDTHAQEMYRALRAIIDDHNEAKPGESGYLKAGRLAQARAVLAAIDKEAT